MKKALCIALVLPFLAAAALADDGDKASDRREEFKKRMQEAIKKYDKDDDGKLNEGERKAMFEDMRKKWAERMQERRGGDDKKPSARPSPSDRASRGGPSRGGSPWSRGPQFGQRPSGPPSFGRGGPSFGRGGPPSFGRRPSGPPSFAQRGKSDDKDGKCPHCGRGGDSDKGKSHARSGHGHRGHGHHARGGDRDRGHGHHARGHHGHRGHGHHGHHRGHGDSKRGDHGKGHDKDKRDRDDDDRRGPPRRGPRA